MEASDITGQYSIMTMQSLVSDSQRSNSIFQMACYSMYALNVSCCCRAATFKNKEISLGVPANHQKKHRKKLL